MASLTRCDLCALKVVRDQSADSKTTEVFFTELRSLQASGSVQKGHPRDIHIGRDDRTEFCAIDSAYFPPKSRHKKCPDFILNTGFTLPEAMSINLSRVANRLSRSMYWIAVLGLPIAAIATIVSCLALYKQLCP